MSKRKEIKWKKENKTLIKEEKKIFIKKTNIKNRIFNISFILIIILDLFVKIFPGDKLLLIKNTYSSITLKVKGIGYKKIFNNYNPNTIYINGIKQKQVNYTYYLNQTDNFIELIWNNAIERTNSMFYNCTNITEIDLSNFDTSKLKCTYFMFYNCTSLTSINFNNFDTSKVVDMEEMFNGCSSLTSLDLSGFDTSLVTWIDHLFNGCINLEYINLKNFKEYQKYKDSDYYEKMFYGVPDNVVICINENNNQNIIFPQIKQKTCYTIDCSDDWKSKQKKNNS